MNKPTPPKDTSDQIIDRFWETVPPLWHQVRAHLRQVATQNYEITVEQFHVLRHIRRGEGSVSGLAAAKQISRPSISKSVDLLVHKGLVTRTPNTSDRRYVQLALTDAGNALLDGIFQDNRQWMRAKLSQIDPQDLQGILQAMDAVKQTLDDKSG